jgi:hypothetical protein
MNAASEKLDELLEKIAQKKLRIPTLKTRGRDRLDFHDVGVASLKDALQEAFLAGATCGASLALDNLKEVT